MISLTILRDAGIFLGLLLPLVVIHELGHFATAKMFGIKVLEFGVGFPPRVKGLVYRTRGGIVTTPSRGFVTDLDTLGPIAWHLLPRAPIHEASGSGA